MKDSKSCYKLPFIIRGLIRERRRAYAFIILIGMFTALLSISMSILGSLKEGIKQTNEKMGAGMMIAASGNENIYEDAILSGGATQSSIPRAYMDILEDSGIPYTYQIYLKSLQAGCCSVPVQIIGYDPETDFIITPWIKSYTDNLKGVVLGFGTGYEGDTIKLFGTEYPVLARLDETGSGLDRTVYVPIQMINGMWKDSIRKGAKYTYDDIDEIVSVYLIPRGYEEKAEELFRDKDVSLIYPGRFITDMEESISGINGLITASLIVYGLMTGISLMMITNLIMESRKKEFATYRLIGISINSLSGNIFLENLIICIGGCLSGLLMSVLLLSMFMDRLAYEFTIPFIKYDVSHLFMNGLKAMIIPMALYMLLTLLFIIRFRNTDYLKIYQET